MSSAAAALIHGAMLIDGAAAAGDSVFEVRDPGRTGDMVAIVEGGSAGHADAAVDAARRAGDGWRRRPVTDRIQVLASAAAAVEEQTELLAPLLSRENGGTLLESRMDLARGAVLLRDFLDRAALFLQPRVTDNQQHWLSVEKAPVGVTALIVPWNSPIVLTASKLAPALLAGNTVVVKPSVYAPAVLGEWLRVIAGFLPPGVLNVVHGDADVGAALTAHPSVRKISFTGSVQVGRQIMAGAAGNLKKVSLELGGNDAAIILDDTDLPAVMPQLCRGVFTRAGQICFAVKRVYVPRSRYEEFYELMCAELSGYRVGHGLDPRTTFGPLISARELARVRGLVEQARRDGALARELGSPVDGASWADGHYMLPVVVRDIDPGAELVSVEQFGPVVPLVAYDTDAEAVRYANDGEYGLCSSVWSGDPQRAVGLARQIEAGATFINSHNLPSVSFDMPFGGVKQSGLGRERTELGFQEYVEEHAIRFVK